MEFILIITTLLVEIFGVHPKQIKRIFNNLYVNLNLTHSCSLIIVELCQLLVFYCAGCDSLSTSMLNSSFAIFKCPIQIINSEINTVRL